MQTHDPLGATVLAFLVLREQRAPALQPRTAPDGTALRDRAATP